MVVGAYFGFVLRMHEDIASKTGFGGIPIIELETIFKYYLFNKLKCSSEEMLLNYLKVATALPQPYFRNLANQQISQFANIERSQLFK